MAVTLTAALATGVVGPSPSDNGMVSEPIIITPNATVDGDTGTYVAKFLKPDRVEVGGNLEYSISGNTVTFKATANIDDSSLIAARVIGYVL
jgi:hypothetical protein